MKFLPFERLEIDTPLSKSAAHLALSLETEVPQWRWNMPHLCHKEFQGVVSSGGFDVRRVIEYRNSFLPVVKGTFHTTPQGTRVSVLMTLHPAVWCFLAVCFGGLGLIVVLVCVEIARRRQLTGLVVLLGPLCIMAFCYAIVTMGFRHEVVNAREALYRILQTTPPQELNQREQCH